MAYLDPNEASANVVSRTLEGIQSHFPLKGKMQTLHLDRLEVPQTLHPDNLRDQHKAKIEGNSFAEPVFGHLRLVDNATGKVVDQRRIRLAEIPKMTQRYSYIMDGQEYQIDNQWQLKPGVYTRRRQNGELETRFNVVGKNPFDLVLDPQSNQIHVDYNKSKLPVYPLMKAMGVDDDTMEKAFGRDIFLANKNARGTAGTLEKFYKSSKREEAPNKDEAHKHFVETMQASRLRPDATSVTLGKPFEAVNGEALLLGAQKLLKVQAGHPEDDRDSLIFKDLRGAGDFIYDKMRGAAKVVSSKAARKINTAKDVRDIVKFDIFNEPIKQAFHKNSAARVATQINPVEMISSNLQTTIMGPGGIKSEQQVMDEAKFVNPSHLGFLDPIHTPEGSKTGVTLRLPMGVKKIGNEAKVSAYNLKTKAFEDIPAGKFMSSKIVLPDQVEWKDGHPKPLGDSVRMAGQGNEIQEGHFKDADYVLRHHSQLFNLTSNLIPFLGNTSGNRASMATRHIEQSVSLLHRDAPLVQVSTGLDKHGIETFENILGRQSSHQAPVAGVVKKITPDSIVVHDGSKEHEVHIYNHYPLNDAKSVLHSNPLVKEGDRVKSGQVIADTNFSKNGTLALGANLRVGYVPFKGYNFEDGVVISESAAKKLSSVHLHKYQVDAAKDLNLSKKSFLIHHPGVYKSAQMDHIQDNGLPKIGSRVKPGDPLILGVKPFELKDRVGESAIRKSITGAQSDKSLRWDGETEGEVVGVTHTKNGINVHVRAIEPMQVGDKLAGRYGNKGIVTLVLPDKEMPHTKDGHHVEVALNPSGVPGRMNVGQVLETAASKIAEKVGKPFVVPSFQKDADMVHHVQDALKKHGLSDTEELHDPVTGQSLGPALVGKQHILKLVHQVDKKVAVSSGMSAPHNPSTYDINLQPKSGQRIGALGMFALLAHGARANIREMQTWKGEGPDDSSKPEAKQWKSQHNEVWKSIQTGLPLPTPKTTFAFRKFEDLLKGSGINIEKHGNELMLSPLTDRHILAMTENRVLTKPGERLEAKVDKKTGELKARPGGLFDEKLTGGHGGMKWSRMELAEPVPNPAFEAPIRALTGLSQKNFNSLVSGEVAINRSGEIVPLGAGSGAITGGEAIKHLLQKIDVPKALEESKKVLAQAKPKDADNALKKVKYLQALDHLNLKPHEAYVLHHVPIIPPAMRPASMMQDGNIKYADINQVYSSFAQVNGELKDSVLSKFLPDSEKTNLRRNMYDGLKAITGIGIPYDDVKHKGLLHQLAGKSPKTGFFQNVLVQKRQDLTMRSTIVPEPSLGLDQVGLPRQHAIDLFRPFIVKKLQDMGAAPTPLDAQKLLLKKGDPYVSKALEKVMEERPVLLKRDPALHKYSVQGFQAKPVEGNAIKIHPLVCGGFNADFDGDTMSVFVPISREAVDEAHKMKPTNNIFTESSKQVAYAPSLESALGIYKLSLTGKDTGKKFTNPAQALDLARSGKMSVTDIFHLNGKPTTAGRVLLSSALPEAMHHDVLHNLDNKLDKKGLPKLLEHLGREHKSDFDRSINKLKDLGNDTSYGTIVVPTSSKEVHNISDPKKNVFIPVGTHTLSLKDFVPDKQVRNEVLGKAHEEVAKIKGMNLSELEKNRRIVSIYSTADKKMRELHEQKMDSNPSNLFTMYRAGVKPGWDQYKQMVIAPMLLKDSADRVIPNPVTKSYAEGLDLAGYWTQMHGARRGSVMKVQEVQEPGYMSKLLMNNTMNLLVGNKDCGTQKGILMHVNEKDIHDRALAQDYKQGNLHLKAGTFLTPDVVGHIKSSNKDAKLLVRSPLKCEHDKGICQHCAGIASDGKLHELGTNLGVLSAHTVGERAVQLTLKSFHTGGVVEQGGGKLLNSFARFEQLTMLPKKIPNAASLAMVSGKVDKIEPTPTGVNVVIGGRRHFVGKDPTGNHLHEALPGTDWKGIQAGMHVEAGQSLSDPNRTYVNPHDLYKATGSIDRVQNHMSSEIYDLYKDEGIKRRHVETVVKAMSNLTKVVHPGDAHDVLHGEFHPLSVVQKTNSDLMKAGKKPIEHTPVLKGVNMLPLAIQEDWMAKLQHQKLRTTVVDAAAVAGRSNIHGMHPIPAVAYAAEFGRTSAHAAQPGLTHLKNVPQHHY
jgi:DNA-directed RNA polymerase subunit beta'